MKHFNGDPAACADHANYSNFCEGFDTVSHIKDSGNRREFESGAVRDIQKGKGRCDLLPLKEVARLIKLNPERLNLKEDLKKETTCCDCLLYINHFMNTKDTDFLLLAVRLFANKMCYGNDNNVALGVLEVAKHFEEGANKYGERNWEKGIPVHCYIDSAIRHLLKFTAGMEDERHDRAFMWNMLCAVWTIEYYPELDDICISFGEIKNDDISI